MFISEQNKIAYHNGEFVNMMRKKKRVSRLSTMKEEGKNQKTEFVFKHTVVNI